MKTNCPGWKANYQTNQHGPIVSSCPNPSHSQLGKPAHEISPQTPARTPPTTMIAFFGPCRPTSLFWTPTNTFIERKCLQIGKPLIQTFSASYKNMGPPTLRRCLTSPLR